MLCIYLYNLAHLSVSCKKFIAWCIVRRRTVLVEVWLLHLTKWKREKKKFLHQIIKYVKQKSIDQNHLSLTLSFILSITLSLILSLSSLSPSLSLLLSLTLSITLSLILSLSSLSPSLSLLLSLSFSLLLSLLFFLSPLSLLHSLYYSLSHSLSHSLSLTLSLHPSLSHKHTYSNSLPKWGCSHFI